MPLEIEMIRSTGREFEQSFKCLDKPTVAELAAVTRYHTIPKVSSPEIWKYSNYEWRVRWYSCD